MRSLNQSTDRYIPISQLARPHARRSVPNYLASLTVQVLYRHHSTDKAWKLSATGDEAHAVWIPKRIVDVGRQDFGDFLVVTMTHQFAAVNRLHTNFDRSRFPDQIDNLTRALECAKASRGFLRPRGRLHPNATA